MVVSTEVFLFLLLSSTIETIITRIGYDATFKLAVPQIVFDGDIITVVVKDSLSIFDISTDSDFKVVKYNNKYHDRISNITFQNREVHFIVHSITEQDAGEYICKTEIQDDIPGCGELLIVALKPTTPNIDVQDTPVDGNTLGLTCNSSSKSLPADHNLTMTYAWERNNKTFSKKQIIKEVMYKNNSGDIFTCQSSERLGFDSEWSQPFLLNVEYGPVAAEIVPNLDNISVEEGSSINIRCLADCNPNCTVIWSDNENQKELTVGQGGCMLNIPSASRNISKQFQCYVYNKHGAKSRNLTMFVHYLPSILIFTANDEKNLTLDVGASVSFSCLVLSNTKTAANISFRGPTGITDITSKARYRLSVSETGFQTQFRSVITSIKDSQDGVYQCRASNEVGFSKPVFVNINVKSKENIKSDNRIERYQDPISPAIWITIPAAVMVIAGVIVVVVCQKKKGNLRRIRYASYLTPALNRRAPAVDNVSDEYADINDDHDRYASINEEDLSAQS